jgi:signal transduction histidine kinase
MLSVHLGVAEVGLPPDAERSRRALESARASARDVVVETQRILALLRRDTDVGDEALRPTPSVAALEPLMASYRSIGLDVRARVEVPTDAVEPSVGVTVYRVVQEALTNAQRHGRGTAAVTLRQVDGELRLDVENAVGPSAEQRGGGFGLVGMLERVESCGGTLEVDRSGDTFRVTAHFRPLEALPA